MVIVGFRDANREHPAGVSIKETGGLLIVSGPGPDAPLIAMYQTWDHAEVVPDETADQE